jgi:hypothetical protein
MNDRVDLTALILLCIRALNLKISFPSPFHIEVLARALDGFVRPEDLTMLLTQRTPTPESLSKYILGSLAEDFISTTDGDPRVVGTSIRLMCLGCVDNYGNMIDDGGRQTHKHPCSGVHPKIKLVIDKRDKAGWIDDEIFNSGCTYDDGTRLSDQTAEGMKERIALDMGFQDCKSSWNIDFDLEE